MVVSDRFPSETHHGRRFIAFGPDGKLYVPVGAPCNICLPDERHGVIQRMNVDGGAIETVARGVRNSVGFDWSPVDRTLWFTDNGRDMLGDDLPADELDRVTRTGEHFGYPFCHQGDSADPEFGAQRACSEFTAPAAKLGAHVAALGMRFYSGTQFPAAYRGNIFIAEHGSWNRSMKSGYQVVRVAVDGQGRAGAPEPFLQGFLQVDGDRPRDGVGPARGRAAAPRRIAVGQRRPRGSDLSRPRPLRALSGLPPRSPPSGGGADPRVPSGQYVGRRSRRSCAEAIALRIERTNPAQITGT